MVLPRRDRARVKSLLLQQPEPFEMPQMWAFCGSRDAQNVGTGAGMRSLHQIAPYRGAAPWRESRGRKTERAVSRWTGERWHRDVPAQGMRDMTLALPQQPLCRGDTGWLCTGSHLPPTSPGDRGHPGGPQLGQGDRRHSSVPPSPLTHTKGPHGNPAVGTELRGRA